METTSGFDMTSLMRSALIWEVPARRGISVTGLNHASVSGLTDANHFLHRSRPRRLERTMPNASYYRAQGTLLETLAQNTTDPELARRYRLYAEEYRRRADETTDDTPPHRRPHYRSNDERRHRA